MVERNDGARSELDEVSSKGRRKRTFLPIFAVVVAVALIALVFESSPFPHERQVLRDGDHLEYEISGLSNNTAFTSGCNITISGSSSTGFGFHLLGDGYPLSAGHIPGFGDDFRPHIAGSPGAAELVGCEKISTPFGDKWIYMLYRFYAPRNEAAIIDIGVDSHIVYRWTVANAAGSYHYTSVLKATNCTAVPSVDRTARPVSVHPLSTPSSVPGTTGLFEASPPGTSNAICSGSVEVGAGQQIHYIIGGNVTMHVFSRSDLLAMDTKGEFHHSYALSRMPGNPGETNATVEPGVYWFIAIYRGSEDTVELNGNEVGGYLILYFE